MKLTKLISVATMFAFVWIVFNKHNGKKKEKKQGALSKLVEGIKEEVQKPLNEIDDKVPPAQNAM